MAEKQLRKRVKPGYQKVRVRVRGQSDAVPADDDNGPKGIPPEPVMDTSKSKPTGLIPG